MISAGVIEAILRLRDEFSAKLEQANSKLQATGQRAQQIGGAMKTAGANLTTGLTLPIVALGGASIKAFSDFEAGMNKVRALSQLDATSQEFQNLTALAKELGATTRFSASEAADALGFLAMAGFTATEQMETLPGVLELAASANLELGQAADITTNILTGYGRTTEEIGATNDVLVKAFTSANTNLSQLGQAFKFVGPVAKAAGVEFEESAAVLSLMGNAGIQATMAGTALRGAISRLLNPTKQVQNAINQVGLVTKDSAGELLPMADIVEQLGEKGATAGQMMQLFGLRAGPAMAGLVGQGSDAIRTLTAELRDSEGTAAQVSRTMLEGVGGAMIRLRSAVEGAFISIGEQLAPAFTSILEKGIAFSNWIQNTLVPAFAALPGPVQQLIIGLAAIAAAIGPLLLIAGSLVAAWGSLATALGGLSISIGGVLAFITGPVGIVAALTLLALRIEPVRTLLAALATIIKNAVVAGFRLVVGWVQQAAAWFGKWFSSIEGGTQFLQNFARGLGVIGDWISKVIGKVVEVADASETWGATTEELADRKLRKLQERVDELTTALGETLLEGTVQDLNSAMLELGNAGGLTEEALSAIAERAIMLKDDGEELTDGLQNVVDWFERTQVEAEPAAAAVDEFAGSTGAAAGETTEFADALDALQKRLGGDGVFGALELWQTALGDTFDLTGLTRQEQDELNGILNDAIEKWEALGETVPENVRAAELATRNWLDTMREIKQLKLSDLGFGLGLDTGFDAEGFATFGVEATDALSRTLPDLGELIGGTDVGTESGVSLATQLGSSFRNTLANGDLGNVVIQAITGGGDIGAALGATIGQSLGNSLGDFIGTKLGGSLGGAIGGVFGPLGAIAGQFLGQGISKAFKFIGGLFGGRSTQENITLTIERDWGAAISEGLSKAMAEGVKSGEFRNDIGAIFANTASIIAEQGGVIAFGLEKSIAKTRDLFVGLERGDITAQQFRDNFEPLFAELLPNAIDKTTGKMREDFKELITLAQRFGEEASIDFQALTDEIAGTEGGMQELLQLMTEGILTADQVSASFDQAFRNALPGAIDEFTGVADASFVALITRIDELGIKSSEVMAFMADQALAGADALERFVESPLSRGPAAFAAMQTAALAFFNTAIENGVPMNEVLAQMGPTLETISDKLEKAGIEAAPAFQAIANAAKLASDEITGPLINGAVAAGDVLVALANTGQLNQQSFRQMGRQVGRTWDRLIEGGATSQELLIAMRGPIAQLIRLQDEYGLELDESTQRIVDQGREAGITGDDAKTATELQIEATDRLIEALDSLIATLTGVGDEAAEAGGEAEGAFGDAAGAAGGIGDELDRIDFNKFVKDAEAAGREAQAAFDRVSFGESPGGIKEIPLQLNAARRSLSDFQRSALDSIGRTQAGVDGLTGSGPGTSSLFADAAAAPTGLQINGRDSAGPSLEGGAPLAGAGGGGGGGGDGDINVTINIQGTTDPESMQKITQEQIGPTFVRLVRENRDQLRSDLRDGIGLQEGQ